MGVHCKNCSEVACGEDHVYAVMLPETCFPSNMAREIGRGWIYVGRTENRVEDRFASNFNPESNAYNSKWARLGITQDNARLMNELNIQLNPVRKEPNDRDPAQYRGYRATYAEFHLAKLLEEAGYCVVSDGRLAFEISPKKKRNN